MLEPSFRELLRDARTLSATDPLEAEAFASEIISIWLHLTLIDGDPDALFGGALIDYLARRGTPEALVLLLGLGAVGAPVTVTAAQQAATALRARRVRAPRWADEIGKPRFVDAWTSSDEYGDQDALIVTFEYPGSGQHCFVVLVDHNLGGVIKKAFLSAEPDSVLEDWRRMPGTPLRSIPAEEAAHRLRDALDAGAAPSADAFASDESSEEVDELRALLHARLGRLPTPSPAAPKPEMTDRERAALVRDFVASPEAAALRRPRAGDDRGGGTRRVAMTLARETARLFVEYKFNEADGEPLRWSPAAVEALLVDALPRNVSLNAAELPAVPAVLRQWVRFAGRVRGVRADAIAATVAAIDSLADRFLLDAVDPKRFGPAKLMYAVMEMEGVDIEDQAAVDQWIDEFSRRDPAEFGAAVQRLRQ